MAQKLKLLVRRIPWSLVLRALACGASWLIFPWWAFFLISLFLYCFSLFQPIKFAPFFIVLLLFTVVLSPDDAPWFAILFSLAFYLLLGLKDFIFIDRRPAQEMLLLLFIFMFSVRFYSSVFARQGVAPAFSALLFGIVFFALSRELIGASTVHRFIPAFLLSELLFGTSLLPLSFFHQAAIFFISAFILVQLISDHAFKTLTARRLLVDFTIFAIVMTAIFGSAPWGL